MSQMPRNKLVRAELAQMLRDNLITPDNHQQLAALYPVGRWNWTSLSRWFLIFGAVSAIAGASILLRQYFHFTFEKLATGLATLMLALFAGAFWLKRSNYARTASAVELLAGFTLIALTFTLGMIFSTGSGDWPSLLAIDLVLLLALTYALNNSLLLVLSACVFFTWFGGRTGYVSGWGAYWFGMNYPLRFLGASLGFSIVGFLHLAMESGVLARYRGFAKIWISVGLFLAEMALWLLSIFGNFGDMMSFRMAGKEELILFNIIWLGFNIALVYAGSRLRFRMLLGYGVTFFIIQLYTLFFAHLAESFGLVLSMFIAGGSALGLAVWLETRRREMAATDQGSSSESQ